MKRMIRHAAKKPGLSPGSLIHIGEKKVERVRIRVMKYNEKELIEQEVSSIDECLALPELTGGTTWINIDGLHETGIIESIGSKYNIHPLVMEDILHTNQRLKMEDFEDYIFVVMRLFTAGNNNHDIQSDQFSLLLGRGWLITFQEAVGTVFDPVRDRIRTGKGRIRKMGADYLAYALMDTVVDNYFVVLEALSGHIESLEEAAIKNPTPAALKKVYDLKGAIALFRKSVVPLREVLGNLSRRESKVITESVELYLRDIYDHVIQVIDNIDTFRDMLSGLIDIYLSSVSNKLNEIMKILTIFAAIFIPLTFITGLYGMNFEYMPELHWKYSYPTLIAIMAGVVIVMIRFFKKKKWF